MWKLPFYNAKIAYSDDALSDRANGVILLPDGSSRQFTRCQRRTKRQVAENTLGTIWYLIPSPTGDLRFETFDDMMQRGFGLTKEVEVS